jgi:hypothetical protein
MPVVKGVRIQQLLNRLGVRTWWGKYTNVSVLNKHNQYRSHALSEDGS